MTYVNVTKLFYLQLDVSIAELIRKAAARQTKEPTHLQQADKPLSSMDMKVRRVGRKVGQRCQSICGYGQVTARNMAWRSQKADKVDHTLAAYKNTAYKTTAYKTTAYNFAAYKIAAYKIALRSDRGATCFGCCNGICT